MNLIPVIQALLLTADRALSVEDIQRVFGQAKTTSNEISSSSDSTEIPSKQEIKAALNHLSQPDENSGIELFETASGFQFRVKSIFLPEIKSLWAEKPARYSRAFLETLALVAYRQPITRAEITEIRGVSTSSFIFKNLLERGWIDIAGHRDIPGRPALYITTKAFLDDFGLKSLSELPTLSTLKSGKESEKEIEEFVNPVC